MLGGLNGYRVLDGPVGTELDRRGVATTLPRWSASAIDDAPGVLAAIHRDYVRAGAVVHTANTFRTKRRDVGDDWERLARRAVEIARAQLPPDHVLAGSIAPLEDCYRPDLSPGARARAEHRELARVLADAGCDVLLCETFPHVGEALVAIEEAAQTGIETWLSLTAGPGCDLLGAAELGRGARAGVERGARAVLVNCVPADRTLEYVEALATAGVPFGAYANAGQPDDRIGWRATDDEPLAAAERYLEHARRWAAVGATLIGSCCGTGPEHVAALAREFHRSSRRDLPR
jgi:S-methylmethionine-dependent homocysteine/selenocysteine methylase